MNNYSIPFCQFFTSFSLGNIWAIIVVGKYRLRILLHWGQTAANKGTWSLWKAYIKPKSIETLAMVDWNDNRVVYIASSKSYEPKRFARRLKKVERKYIREQQLNQFHCYNQNMSTEWTRTWQRTGLISEWKNGGGPILLEQSMLFFRMGGCCNVLTEMKLMIVSASPSFSRRCCQYSFSIIFKGRQIISKYI